MLRKIALLVLSIIIVSVVCVQAEDVRVKGRVKSKNAGAVSKDENAVEAHSDPKTPAEFQEIDDLARDIKQTLTILQRDIEKILAGMRSVAARKSTLESEKTTIEMLTVQGDSKNQSIAVLSSEIKNLAGQIDDYGALYRQKDGEFKGLSVKLNDLDIKRKGLSELRAVTGAFKNADADTGALKLSADDEAVKSIHKRIDDVLSDAKAAQGKAVGSLVGLNSPGGVSGLNNVPKWILEKIKAKGRKMETSYGDMVVAKDGGVTVISVKKENDARFRSAYEKMIKESYEADGIEYFVLGSGS
ncbi:MAG: hypothetical protein HQL08_00620 [Nitrospirae bacterium]|nr:hypothetical protein [Nitrospirota bacterium]